MKEEVPIRYTLLELTQRILSSMESDEVSDISETQESKDVVDIIKECYFDIVGQNNLADHLGIFKLDSSGDNTKPTLMTIPENVIRIDWLKYNYTDILNPLYKPLRFCPVDEFYFYQGQMNVDDSLIDTMTVSIGGNNNVFKYYNDRPPNYYTIFDEFHVVFDAYDALVDSTLQTVKSQGYGLVSPSFVRSNTTILDLDPRQFQLLLQDAKATAHVELKQQANPKAEQKYRRNQILAQKSRLDNDPSETRQKIKYNMGRNHR